MADVIPPSAPTPTDKQPAAPVDKNADVSALLKQWQTEQQAWAAPAPPVTDATTVTRASDKVEVKAKSEIAESSTDPYALIAKAYKDAQELQALATSGKSLTDRIEVKDANQEVRNVSVGQRINELKAEIDKATKAAIGAADDIRQTPQGNVRNGDTVQELNSANAVKVAEQAARLGMKPGDVNTDDLARRLGFDLSKLTHEQVMSALDNQKETDATRLDLIALYRLSYERDALKSLALAPGVTRMVAAQMRLSGMTDPDGQVGNQANGGFSKPSAKELTDAFTLLSQAGRLNGEVKASNQYLELNARATALYAQGQEDRTKDILVGLKTAKELEAKGKFEAAEEQYKKALRLAEQTDLKFLAAQLQEPHNRQNADVAQRLVDIVNISTQAKVDYGKFLNKQGRYAESYPLLIKAGADVPELTANDGTFNTALAEASAGKSMPKETLEAHTLAFQTALNAKDFVTADQELKFIRKNYQDTMAHLNKNNEALNKDIAAVKAQLELLNKNTELDLAQKKIEQDRLAREIGMMEKIVELNKGFNKQWPGIQFMAAMLSFAQGGEGENPEAYALFQAVKDSDLCKENPKMAEALDKLMEMTRDRAWYEHIGEFFAKAAPYIAAIGVGLAVGALTIWSGPGAIVCGAGAAGAVLTGTCAVGAGFVAGGGAGYLTKSAVDGKWASGRDFVEFGFYGGAAAGSVAIGPVLGGFGVTAPTGTTTMATAGRFALTRGAPAVVFGFGSEVPKEALKVMLDDKPLWQATKDAGYHGGMSSLMYGMMPGYGKTMDAALAAERQPLAMAMSKAWGTVKPMATMQGSTMSRIMAGSMVGIPVGYSLYQYKSPWELPLLGRPAHFDLDPNDPLQERRLWQRYNWAEQLPDMLEEQKKKEQAKK